MERQSYLCPQRLQAKFMLGWWTVSELLIALSLLLLLLMTGAAWFFGSLIAAWLLVSCHPDGTTSLLRMLGKQTSYHTSAQLYTQMTPEQRRAKSNAKKALPIQDIIKFRLDDKYVQSDGEYIYFYRYYPPNTHIMTEDEIQAEIENMGRLFDTLNCPLSLFAADKVENLDAIKNYYLSLPVSYEYITTEIVESIERSDVESNAVQRAYYIVYRTQEADKDILSTLLNRGLHVERATKPEIAVLLRNYLVREFLNCDIYTIAQEVSSIPGVQKAKPAVYDKEIQRRLSPHNIHFSPTYGEQGNVLRKTLMVKNYPTSIPPCALMEVAKTRGITFNLRITPMSRAVARRLINNQTKQQNVKKYKAQATERIEGQENENLIRDFYADINRHQGVIYYVNVFVELYGKNKEELAALESHIADILAGVSITYDSLRLDQKNAFVSVQPLGKDLFLSEANNMPSKTLAALYPFSSSACLDTRGMALGHTEDGGPFYYDLDKRTETMTNGNYFGAGYSGMGKSHLQKKIVKHKRMNGDRIYINDPEGEYGDLVHQMGGTVINRASGRWKNNIFEVRRLKDIGDEAEDGLGYGGETPMYFQHLSWLQEQLGIIHSGLSAEGIQALMIIVQDVYSAFGIDEHTDFSKLTSLDYPIYTDIYKFIEENSQADYKMIPARLMKQLLLHTKSCHDGPLSVYFNGHTNIHVSDFICFDYHDLLESADDIVSAVLNNDYTWQWQQAMQNAHTGRNTFIANDELHMFLRNPYMRRLLSSTILRARKYDASIGCFTQQILHCLNNEYKHELSAILDMSPTKFLFHPGEVDMVQIQETLHLRPGEIRYLEQARRGHCLVLSGTERYAVHIGKYPHEDELFGKRGGR